jgi:ABC-type enterochelin transport system substrate-binding protein
MEMLEALIKRYEAQIAEAEATIEIYLSNSVGIGEHPQHIEELDKLFGKIAEAEDKLKIVERWED